MPVSKKLRSDLRQFWGSLPYLAKPSSAICQYPTKCTCHAKLATVVVAERLRTVCLLGSSTSEAVSRISRQCCNLLSQRAEHARCVNVRILLNLVKLTYTSLGSQTKTTHNPPRAATWRNKCDFSCSPTLQCMHTGPSASGRLCLQIQEMLKVRLLSGSPTGCLCLQLPRFCHHATC